MPRRVVLDDLLAGERRPASELAHRADAAGCRIALALPLRHRDHRPGPLVPAGRVGEHLEHRLGRRRRLDTVNSYVDSAMSGPLGPVRVHPVGQRELVATHSRGVVTQQRTHLVEHRAPAGRAGAPRRGSRCAPARRRRRGRAAARGGTSPRAADRTRVSPRTPTSRHSSWARHGARFSTRSMIDHTSSTHGTDRSRAFHTSADRPPGRSTRWNSASAAAASNQWNAWATVMASSDASRERQGLRGRGTPVGHRGGVAPHPLDRFDGHDPRAGRRRAAG